jgi:hypothetical protein
LARCAEVAVGKSAFDAVDDILHPAVYPVRV